MPIRTTEVTRLVEVACDAMVRYMETEAASGHDHVTADELFSAYLTLAYSALCAAKNLGVNLEIFREPLVQMYAVLPTLASVN